MEKTDLGERCVSVSQPHTSPRAAICRHRCPRFIGISRRAVVSAVLFREDHVLSNSWKAHVHAGPYREVKEHFSFMKNYLILNNGNHYERGQFT